MSNGGKETKENGHERRIEGSTRNACLLRPIHHDRNTGDHMIKITFYSISLGAEINTYGDEDWDIDHLYVLDDKGNVYEELPANMLTPRADIEIAALIQEALNNMEPGYQEPDEYHEPEYFIRGVHC